MLKKLKRIGIYLTAAFSLATPSLSRADGLDDLINKVAIDEKNGEWRDHLLISFFQTELDAILFNKVGSENPAALAAKTRFVETIAHQGLYTPIVERKITPIYSLSDIAGIELAVKTYNSIGEDVKTVADKLTRIPDRKELVTLGVIAGLGYLLKQEKGPLDIDLHAKERIDNTTLSHVAYFWYSTVRLSAQTRSIKPSYSPKKVAWRNFKLALVKESIYDAGWGTGPSLLDAGADAIGVFLGFKTAEYITRRGISLPESIAIIPQRYRGLKIEYRF